MRRFCRSAFALPSQHRDSQQLSLLRTRTQLWWEVLSLVENWRQKHILKIARCSLWSALIRTGCALTTMHGGILSCYSDFLLSSLNLPCHSPNNRMTMATCYTVIGELITGSGNGNRPTFHFSPLHFQNEKSKITSILFTFIFSVLLLTWSMLTCFNMKLCLYLLLIWCSRYLNFYF